MSELDPESRALLALAKSARTPTPEDRARVASRLALAAGFSAAAATSVGVAKAAGAKAGTTWGALQLGIAGSLLLSAAVGTYLSFAKPSPRTAANVPALVAASPRAEETRARSDAPQPEAAEPQVQNALAPAPTPTTRTADLRAKRAAASPTSESELALLHQAQAAWRAHEPPRALELLQQHRRRYPRSELRSEREALEVLVLCEVGRAKEAATVARALLKRAPASPARATIEQSCALE